MKSDNTYILKKLLKKSNELNLPSSISYIVIYSFLYKFCSDHLKDYLLLIIEDVDLTLDDAFEKSEYQEIFKKEAFNFHGFYIKKRKAFYEEILNKKDLNEFFKALRENIIFEDKNHEKYFEFIFNLLDEKLYFEGFENEILEIISLIGKLDVFDEECMIEDVFDSLSQSRLINIKHSDENIIQILSTLISSQKDYIQKVYDPFIRDASSLIRLSKDSRLGFQKCYAKETNKLKYFYSIARLFIHNFDFNSVNIDNINALESVDINKTSFDAIISQIPNINDNFVKNQSLELLRRIKRNELEEILLENFEIDSKSFNYDDELNNALENIINQMNFENGVDLNFKKEYQSLNQCNYLFLINLVESLKYDGLMVVSISNSFTSINSLKILRKYLTEEKNYIDTIISIKNENIIVFCKNKENKAILFMDLDDNFSVNQIRDVFIQKSDIDSFSRLVYIEEVRENDYDLSTLRYIDKSNEEFISLNDLKKQKKQLDSKRNDLNSKIYQMMEELNINI